jgi:hypothetical protein
LNADAQTVEQAVDNLNAIIPSMLYRLLWLFDEDETLVIASVLCPPRKSIA